MHYNFLILSMTYSLSVGIKKATKMTGEDNSEDRYYTFKPYFGLLKS